MARPVNYYQYEEGANEYFQVNPFPSKFTGIYFPVDTAVSRVIPLLTDASYRPSALYTKLSGLLNGVFGEQPVFSSFIYGDFTPQPSESGYFFVAYTGQITGQLIDRPNFFVQVTGLYSTINIDSYNINTIISGYLDSVYPIISSNSFDISGEYLGVNFEDSLFSTNITGSVIKGYKETALINCLVSSISYSRGQLQIITGYQEKESINFGLVAITYVAG